MTSLAKIGRKIFVTAAIITISCGVTYYATEKQNESEIAGLNSRIDSLNNKVLQARVTQRISEQMEDIASQQSVISDRERNRAEMQSKIAETERRKAEVEKGLAMEAQKKALISAEQARKAQELAEKESKRATDNMLIAENARSHADTLLYQSLANSLAQSSLTQYSSGNEDLQRLLACAAWHYSEQYPGNQTSMQNIYRSLLFSSGSVKNTGGVLRGNIMKIHISHDGVICITDYGEIFLDNGQSYAVNIDKNNFRDFFSYGKKRNLALCSDGRLLDIDISNIETANSGKDIAYTTRLQLPKGFWKKLLIYKDNTTFLALADNMVAWIDANTLTLKATAQTNGKTTAMGKQFDTLHVFCENGTHYISDTDGVLTPLELDNIKDTKVTCYYYIKQKDLHVLGLETGRIMIFDKNGVKQCELLGHSGPITCLNTWDDLLASTGYDSTMRLWDISDLHALITPITMGFDYWPLTFDVDKKSKLVWIGTEKGYTPHFCSSIVLNAQNAKDQLSREFTQEEWDHYVGKGIKRISFMK